MMAKKILTTEEFIVKAVKKHGPLYDYSKVRYTRGHIKVPIICPIHGEFYQKPSAHLFGKGCFQCSIDRKKLSLDTFINRVKNIHENKYEYSKVD